GPGLRLQARGQRGAVRAVLHYENGQDGNGFAHQPFDYGKPWRAPVGASRRGCRRDISPRAAGGNIRCFMNNKDSLVILVDDDPSFRRSTERLLRTAGYQVLSFASALEFLHSPHPDVPSCLVSDVRMPGLNGLDLQRE